MSEHKDPSPKKAWTGDLPEPKPPKNTTTKSVKTRGQAPPLPYRGQKK